MILFLKSVKSRAKIPAPIIADLIAEQNRGTEDYYFLLKNGSKNGSISESLRNSLTHTKILSSYWGEILG